MGLQESRYALTYAAVMKHDAMVLLTHRNWLAVATSVNVVLSIINTPQASILSTSSHQ